MNERIRELAEESGAGWDDKYHWYVGNEQMKKFAELIVRECIKVCENGWEGEFTVAGIRQCVVDLKEHFGAEQ